MSSATPSRQLDVCLALTQAISRAERVEAIYDAALEALEHGLGVQRASILVFDPDRVMRFKAWRGLSDGYRRAVEGHTPWTPETLDAEPIVVADVAADPELVRYLPTFQGENIAALVFVPLVSPRGVIGKFMLYFAEPHAPDASEMALARVVAAQVAFAVQRARAEGTARDQERELRLVTDSAPVFLAHIGRDLRYRFVNAPYAERLGMSREHIVGRTIAEVIGNEGYARIEPYVQAALAGQPVEFQVEIPYERLGTRSMHCSYAPEVTAEGQVDGLIAVITDDTERRRAEVALGESEARYRQLYDEVREADRQKDEFLAVLAHELRNPLAPMRTAVQLMQIAGADPARLERARRVIDRQLQQMVRLIDDLLDVSRITRGKIELRTERGSLTAAVQTAVEASRPVIEAAGHELTITFPPDPIYVEADPTRLAQVFSNLLNNAAKYTEQGGQIGLTIDRQGDVAVVRVRDSGIGIPGDMLSRIFDMFTQVDRSLEKAHGGLGIGLTLAKRLAELHGGSIEAESEGPGRGSQFTVRLPLGTSPGRVPAPTVAVITTGGAPRRRRILVADDNHDAVASLGEMLATAGHDVRTAHDGLEALQIAGEFEPEIVLLDLGMPRMNGFEAARRIREQAGAHPPVLIALTGWGHQEDRRRSQRAGFHHHLIKPVDVAVLDELLATVPPVQT